MLFYYIQALKNYANFKGRTSRQAFWMFILTCFIISIILQIPFAFAPHPMPQATVSGIMTTHYTGFFLVWKVLTNIYALFLVIPGLAIAARRLHDIGRTGWWQLFYLLPLIGGIVLIVMWCMAGNTGANEYGDPANDLKP